MYLETLCFVSILFCICLIVYNLELLQSCIQNVWLLWLSKILWLSRISIHLCFYLYIRELTVYPHWAFQGTWNRKDYIQFTIQGEITLFSNFYQIHVQIIQLFLHGLHWYNNTVFLICSFHVSVQYPCLRLLHGKPIVLYYSTNCEPSVQLWHYVFPFTLPLSCWLDRNNISLNQ